MELKHPEACIQCGICVTVCPVEMVGGHAIVTFLADPEASDYSVWLCSSCWRCQEACPAGVSIYELMMEERRRQPPPGGYQEALEKVLTTGLALEVTQDELDHNRAAWGLEPVELPPPGLTNQVFRKRSGRNLVCSPSRKDLARVEDG